MSTKISQAERYGFLADCEGVPEELLSQFEAEEDERKLRSSINLGGILIDTSYPCNTSNYSSGSKRAKSAIRWIVIHYTGGIGSALANVKYYCNTALPSGHKASAHFFVGHASESAMTYQSIDPLRVAYHAPGRNSDGIGIEVCCHNDTGDRTAASLDWYFDPETVDALVKLVRYLMQTYGVSVDNVIRHYDVTGKICPAMWVHDEAGWLAFKARLVEGHTELVNSVAAKIGLSSPEYWNNVLTGATEVEAEYLRAVFRKVCAEAGVAYGVSTLYSDADAVLALSGDDYWPDVLEGRVKVSAANMVSLFEKIDAVI